MWPQSIDRKNEAMFSGILWDKRMHFDENMMVSVALNPAQRSGTTT